ncbi:MAG: aldo/keto reductase [Alphaproteobacteria bacterium]|nr:aldo/keto reductase [Alphaproteobacteria bacterium]
MKTRNLGNSGLTVSAVGLGCMGMSVFYGAGNDDAASIKTINHAIDLGVTFFDTAELYGNGHNEELLGKAVKGRRDDVILATKFGLRLIEGGGVTPANGNPDYVKAACDESLKRLGVDVIDLYYAHRVDPTVPVEEMVGAMAELVQAGKVRHLGLNEAGAGSIRKAHAVHPIAAVQTEYSLWSREVETDVIPTCQELGIGFVPYSPLSRGFLTGVFEKADDVKVDGDTRSFMPRFTPEHFNANKALVDKLGEIAAAKGCTVAQLAIAWVMAQGDTIVPIPGTRKIARLDENVGAADVALSSDDLAAIEAASPADAVSGLRYPEAAMSSVNI